MQKSSSQSSQNKSSDVKTIVTITVKLFVICVVTAGLLAVVNALTKDKIAENIAKTKEESIAKMFEGEFEIQPYSSSEDFEEMGITEVNYVHQNNEHIGYVAEVAPNGFGGEIILLVGVGKDGKVVGVDVIDQGETPGIGTRIKDDVTFVERFKGADGSNVSDVELLAGATISSTAVRNGVETALSIYDKVVCGGAQ